MIRIFIYHSSDESDECSTVTIISNSEFRAYALALVNFKQHNYKGSPVRLALD